MIRYNFKDEYEQKSRLFGKFALRLGLSPDVLTLLSLPISLLTAYLLAQGSFIWGVLGIGLLGLVDVLDGATARAGNTCTPFGTVFDHVIDRYTEFIVFTGVLLSQRVAPSWVIFAISGMIMASYVRAKAESAGGWKKCTVGLVGRAEKFTLLVIGLVAAATPLQLPILTWSLIAIGVLSHVTAYQRLIYTRKMILNPDAVPEAGKATLRNDAVEEK